jgi:hypothetical protein
MKKTNDIMEAWKRHARVAVSLSHLKISIASHGIVMGVQANAGPVCENVSVNGRRNIQKKRESTDNGIVIDIASAISVYAQKILNARMRGVRKNEREPESPVVYCRYQIRQNAIRMANAFVRLAGVVRTPKRSRRGRIRTVWIHIAESVALV